MPGLHDNPHEADVFYRGQAIHVTGPAAVLVGRIARAADRINKIAIGRVVEVRQGSPSEGLILVVEPYANLDDLHFVQVILYSPESESAAQAD